MLRARGFLKGTADSFLGCNNFHIHATMALRNPKCMFNSATALHRVFIAPIEQSNLLISRRLPPPRQALSPSVLQTRLYTAGPVPEKRTIQDDLIKSWSIRLVNDDGTLGEIRSTRQVLEEIDRNVYSLVQVGPTVPGVPSVCKIMNKKAMREAEKARAKAARNNSGNVKTLELNWAIDKGDLGHRLDKMKKFLEKGLKVEIALASKRRGKQATEEEAAALLRRIRETVQELPGSKELKPMEGRMLRTATMFFGKSESG